MGSCLVECRHGIADLDRLYARGTISRRQFIAGLAALGLTAASVESWVGADALVAEAATPAARYLVIVVLDAFRPDYMQLESMPALSALVSAGVTYDQAWVGQIEGFTPAGHATIATGCMPRHTGVLGFEWRDPATQQEALNGWPPEVLQGQLEDTLRQSGVDSIALAIKNNDRNARVVAISSEKVYAADAIGGYAADYILHYQRTADGKSLVPAAVPNHTPPASFFSRPGLKQHLPLGHFTDWDYLSTILSLEAVAEFRPKALLVNLPSADYYGHPYGGPASPGLFRQVAAGIDRNIGRIVQAYRDAGIFDQTLLVVAADHGMVPNVHAVDGKLTKAAVAAGGGDYLFHTGGTAAYIYLKKSSASKAVAQAMAQAPNTAGAYYLLDKRGTYYYDLAPGVTVDPAVNAANHYLLSTFVGPRAPDVVAPFRENTIGTELTVAHGDHGGLNWGAQQVPLIFSGPGVASGITSHFPARLVDIAPTVLRLLGLPARPMDGAVLADALAEATAQEVVVQASRAPTLAARQSALMRQSADNVAEDAQAQQSSPQPRPAHP
jgi:predicted AlkP superfamily pyrophosphatase or phosphodiesterase